MNTSIPCKDRGKLAAWGTPVRGKVERQNFTVLFHSVHFDLLYFLVIAITRMSWTWYAPLHKDCWVIRESRKAMDVFSVTRRSRSDVSD